MLIDIYFRVRTLGREAKASVCGPTIPHIELFMSDPAADPHILALDVGTLSVRASTYDQLGKVRVAAARPLGLERHSDTEIEQDPQELIGGLKSTLQDVLAQSAQEGHPIGVAGLSTQRSSVIAWHRQTGEPLSPVLSWQDRRAAHYLERLSNQAHTIKGRSGLFLSPHYGASKLRWLYDNCEAVQAAARSGDLQFGPLAAFVIHHLVEGRPAIVDHVNASRTQLMDLEQRNWSADLLQRFRLQRPLLPACQPTQAFFGCLAGTQIPLQAVNGDQNAAIHGLGKLDEGTFIVNVGTGAFVLLATGNRPINHPRLLASIANSTPETATYLLEGTVNGAGAAIKWAEEQWGEQNLSQRLEEWLPVVKDPPVFVNTIGGLGSPLWTEGPTPYFNQDGDLAQKSVAILESIIFLLQINLEMMTNTGQDVRRIRISGGLSALDGLCQLLADLTQRLVVRSEVTQATSRGIAWLAGQPKYDWSELANDYFLPRQNRPLQARYRTFCSLLGWQ